ncbi:DUF2017 domain-containing protein [Spiractinospora alimapuensis]|uniref:DUF2017 domain-containing protein n=1 Tax=Spiractinospora alimapuensis TaxID=2820884 RepID=UPI001F1690C3|nr:DUF2017 domain-containing protein [Spiractinospora alimapuensis]QVQ54187.1 DUF2017 domain-containing protein [Spiractinospora alimapuensis]
MTLGFRRTWGGSIVIDLDPEEATVLRSMANLVLSLVDPPEPKDELAELVGIGEQREAPDDPVLARLFPDAYSQDEESAGDFRRYTEDGLRSEKRAAAESIIEVVPESGGRIELDDEQGLTWMKSLNDVRLALGTRIGIQQDTGRPPQDASMEDWAAVNIYDWLTALQDSLVRAVR